METSPSSSRNKTLLWIGGGCLAILVCMLAVFLFGFGGLYWLGSQVADEVDISWDMPTGMELNENFEFKITITNISTLPVELIEIDFNTNYLRGFLIESTTPQYVDTFEYTPLTGGELFQSYTFYKSIAPGEALTITFNGRVVLRGDFDGTILICIDSAFNCRSNVVRTIVP